MPVKEKCEGDMLFDGTCMGNGEDCQGMSCQLGFYGEEELPENCENCFYFDEELADPYCTETNYDNLKSFPFKKNMHCFVEKDRY